ncbi:GntR family transcriptional regulator [Nocardiopsis terrae]|uniref:DNA-binding transcriptional MocR family regulator n=1 Tax=Nocardiopsis terrae TaxID=372655 RepID=A0ABR9HIV6_9ACTN|nr:PLP-dependent aminotransferase family protein [Nocardiopsis terrae]MBE1458962.1 DNA-binding transcriptional MocR family regulator [Nocardiopsis terrae]GHC87325.1 GntR family transcriptional regulator [Nocardiopsis terrae]
MARQRTDRPGTGGGTRRINGRLLARLIGEAPVERPYYLAIARSVSGLVLDGRVPTHTRLPAERDLAAALGVSRNTVTAAYAWLRDNSFLDSRQGAGSWTVLPDSGTRGSAPFTPAAEQIDLGVAAPPAVDGLREAAFHASEQLAAHVGGIGYYPYGLPELRHAIARRYVERGLPTAPEQIFVTSGGQQGITLAMDLLVQQGDEVLLESPTYPHGLDAARRNGARIRTTGVTPQGWDMEYLVDSFRQRRPAAAYMIPDFQNPTGALMDDEERRILVREARRAGTHLIIDESGAELAIDSGDLPSPVAVHDTDGRVLTVGSVAKLLWGGLRVGWVRATPPMVTRLMAVRQRFDLAGSVHDQLTATHLLSDVLRVRAERSRQLRRNRDALLSALRERLPAWRPSVPGGGLVLWASLPQPVATSLAEAAVRHGVHPAAGPVFGVDGTLERYLRLAYTRPPDVLADAVERLAAAYAETLAHPSQPRGQLYL